MAGYALSTWKAPRPSEEVEMDEGTKKVNALDAESSEASGEHEQFGQQGGKQCPSG